VLRFPGLLSLSIFAVNRSITSRTSSYPAVCCLSWPSLRLFCNRAVPSDLDSVRTIAKLVFFCQISFYPIDNIYGERRKHQNIHLTRSVHNNDANSNYSLIATVRLGLYLGLIFKISRVYFWVIVSLSIIVFFYLLHCLETGHL